MRTALVAFFALHILSASMTLGLPFVIAWFDRRREGIARGMTPVALVNMSVTVVLGVGALLFISMAHPRAFVGAAVARFAALMSVLALLVVAFGSMYAYKLRHWRPGPLVAGVAVLAVAGVFAAIAATWSPPTRWPLRLSHFVPLAFAASGVAMMVRFAGEEESAIGARLAFFGTLAQAATGILVLLNVPWRSSGWLVYLAPGGAALFLVLLGLLLLRPRVTRAQAVGAAVALLFVVLSMAALRDGVRG